MPTNSGAGYRFGGAILAATGAVLFAITQTVATTTTSTPDYVHRGFVTGSAALTVIGVVVVALGIIRGWLMGTMVYVDRPARPEPRKAEVEESDDAFVDALSAYEDQLAKGSKVTRLFRPARRDDLPKRN